MLGRHTARLLCLINITEQTIVGSHPQKMISSSPNHHRQHLHTQIPTPAASPSLTKVGEFMFLENMRTGEAREMENKPTCHCLDRNATTRGGEGCVSDKAEGGTSVSTFLSPFLPPPSCSPLMASSSQGERKEI